MLLFHHRRSWILFTLFILHFHSFLFFLFFPPQAQARCHRIGQNKAVKVYRLITRNSYEREMFDRASLKLGLDKAVLQSMSGRDNSLGGGGVRNRPLESYFSSCFTCCPRISYKRRNRGPLIGTSCFTFHPVDDPAAAFQEGDRRPVETRCIRCTHGRGRRGRQVLWGRYRPDPATQNQNHHHRVRGTRVHFCQGFVFP